MGAPVSLPNPICSSSNQSAALEAQPQGKASSFAYPKAREKSGPVLCDTPDVLDDSSDNSMPLSKILVLLRREKRAKCSISSKPKKARSSTAMAIEASQRSYTHNADLKTNNSMNSSLHAKLTLIALRGAENNNANTTKAKPKTTAKQTKSTPRTGESKGQPAKVTPSQGSSPRPIKPAESCNGQRKVPSIEKPVQTRLTLAQASTQRAAPKKAGASIAPTLKRSRGQDTVGSSEGGQRKRPRVIAPELRSERGASSVVPASTTVKKDQTNITKSNSQQVNQQRGLANKLSLPRPKNLTEMEASKTHESTSDARSAQQQVHEVINITAPHDANILHSHQQTGSSISYQTPPQSSIESSPSPVSQKGSSSSQLPALSGDRNQLPDGFRQTVSAHTLRQDGPTLLPTTAAAKAQETARAAVPSQDEIAAAAAQFQSIQARHNDTVPEASIIELPAPPATGLHQLDHDEADEVILSPQEAEKQKRLVDNRLRRIRREVNRGFPDKSEAEKEEICQTKSNQYFDRLTEKLRKNARAIQGKQLGRALKRKEAGRDIAVVAAAGREPLVPVQLIKTPKKNGRPDRTVAAVTAAVEKPFVVAQSGVPALQALQSTQIITVYVVYMSRPIAEEKIREPFMTRTRVFGDLDKANHYAMQLLCGTPSERAKKLIQQIDSWSVEFVNRLFVGRTRRSDRICIHVDVRKEQQVVGNMEPEILRDQYIDQGILQLHRKRYDVWEVRMIPKVWLYTEEEDNDEELERALDQQDAAAVDVPDQLSNDTDNAEAAVRESIEEGDDLRGLEGRDLVVALGKLSACDGVIDDLETSEQDPAAAAAATAAAATNQVSSPIDDDDGNQGDDYRRCPTPISAHCPFNPLDPYSDCEVQHIPYGSFTDLPSANARAFAVARQAWKPRSCDIDAVTHWTQVITPCIQQEMGAMDMERESAEIVCPIRPFHGVNSRRPWLFVHAKVSVVETIPEGPLDTEMGFEYDARPAVTRKRQRNEAVQSQREREREREMNRTPAPPPPAAATADIPGGQHGVERLQEEDVRRDEDLEHALQLESDSDEGETSEEE